MSIAVCLDGFVQDTAGYEVVATMVGPHMLTSNGHSPRVDRAPVVFKDVAMPFRANDLDETDALVGSG